MSKFYRYLSFGALSLLLTAMPALCAELLSDGFTDPVESYNKGWRNMNAGEGGMSLTISGGSATLDNSGSDYIGEYLYDFGSNKPATFTFDFVLKSIEPQNNIAGALFCRPPSSSGNPSGGYILSVKGNTAIVYKLNVGATTISADPIFQKNSLDLLPADNKLTVSKSGSTFNIFANDAFVGDFTDAAYASGDISLFMFSATKTVFGAVRVTDAFTAGGKRTEFSDNFDNGLSKYWDYLNYGSEPDVKAVSGKMKIKTGAGEWAGPYVDLDLTDFTAKVEVSYISGNTDTPYGFVLLGEAPSDAVHFAIRGGGRYAVWKASDDDYTPVYNSKIRGKAPDELGPGVILIDTLEIKKQKGSSDYEFYVNGEQLIHSQERPDALVTFKITGIGLFCGSSLEVDFDNFYAKNEGTASIRPTYNNKRISHAASAQKSANRNYYDLRGRKRYTLNAAQNNRALVKRSAGMYVNENGREVYVKGRRTRN